MKLTKKRNEKGFTLAELLIVVAIIAVLVAIAIPVFTSQLERSRESTDLANIRSAYAEVVTQVLEDGASDITATVEKQQKVDGWASVNDDQEIGGIKVKANLKSTDATVIKYTKSDGKVTIDDNEVVNSFVSGS